MPLTDITPMISLSEKIENTVKKFIHHTYQISIPTVEMQPTRKDFEGELTIVVFPMLKFIKGNPAIIANQIGEHLQDTVKEVNRYNVIQGFLNLVIGDEYYLQAFREISESQNWGLAPSRSKPAIMVEYSSPNTNKPLHLGHIRNNLLGYSVARILEAAGHKVYKTQIINDRGIHICKSMVAWQKFGNGENPADSPLKGDMLVGKYYVAFDKEYKSQIAELESKGMPRKEAEKKAPILLEAQETLRKWEAGDTQTVSLWKMMNGWVYKGFEETYKRLGVDFDQLYYESDTYLLGRDIIAEGLEKGVFFKKEDGSVWIDLSAEGLDEKLVLRADGTAVYMTQDIGTAIQRVKDFPDIGGMVYTVGNEQDYHFKVLFLILKKLGYNWAEKLYHLSYGMVDLPSGKMKSREGTVVDADDLITQMEETAANISSELGKLDGLSEKEKIELYATIGMGALKYYILKVDPKKRILFNPEESVDFQGNTGPFIQYTYARIQSILRKAMELHITPKVSTEIKLEDKEKQLILQLLSFPAKVEEAAENHSPALIANFIYDLVKEFNSFYQQLSILGATSEYMIQFRTLLAQEVGKAIKTGFSLLGIKVPERM